MRSLLSPCSLGPVALRNPVVFLPFYTAYADAAGLVTETLFQHYKRVASSGIGLVVVEASRLRHSASPFALSAFGEEHLPGLRLLADGIRAQGAATSLQICHPGRFSFAPGAIAPSAVAPFGNPALLPRAMTEQDMEEICADFAEAADIARQAGFDGVELHGGTGYLLASCLSPLTNQRTDDYGGSLENRLRFPLRVCAAVRERVGDYPVAYRFMAKEYVEGGLSLEEGAAAAALLARELQPWYLSVTAGTYECFALLAQDKDSTPAGYMLDSARAVKEAVPGVPVIAAGHLQTEEICGQALDRGVADAIGLGRVLFADNDWLRKISGEVAEPVRACVQCNTCQTLVSEGRPVFCSRWTREERTARLQGLPEERLAGRKAKS